MLSKITFQKTEQIWLLFEAFLIFLFVFVLFCFVLKKNFWTLFALHNKEM